MKGITAPSRSALQQTIGDEEMQIGDIVVPVGNLILSDDRNGNYRLAICASVEPLALVSVENDQCWGYIQPEMVMSVGTAFPEYAKAAVETWQATTDETKELMKKEMLSYKLRRL